jgi:hypothetical protein
MAANIPDQGAIAHLGGQFHHNVFSDVQKHFNEKSKKAATAAKNVAAHNAQARNAYASSVNQAVQQGRKNFAKNQQAQAKSAAQAQKAHAQGVKSGRVAPAQGAPPRTFAMAPSAGQKKQASTMQQQRNFAHGEALKFQAAQFKVKQQQVNNAHSEALKEANKRAKGGSVTTASTPQTSMSPSFSSAPATHTPIKAQSIPATSFSSQLAPQKPLAKPQGTATASFSSASSPSAVKPPKPLPKGPSSSSLPNIPGGPMQRPSGVTGPQFSHGDASPKVNGPYPQHIHPEGSSIAPLPNLTAAQPKPNEFTVGSRNAKPGGLAARGSQLEAWAIGRQAEIRKQRGSNSTQLKFGEQ